MRLYFVCLFASEQEGFLYCGDCDDQAFLTGFSYDITGNEMWMCKHSDIVSQNV